MDRHAAAGSCNGKCDGESCDAASIAAAALCSPLLQRHNYRPRPPTSDKGTSTDDLAPAASAATAATAASAASAAAPVKPSGGSADALVRSGVRVTDL